MKFALVVLAFITPISLSLLFSALTIPSSEPSERAMIASQLQVFSTFDDADGDGLSNRHESLWRTDWQDPDSDGDGFKDGEEVLSGHDPAKAGPNDFLEPTKNLTNKAATLLLGALSSGAIQEGSEDNQVYLGYVTEEIFDEYQKFTMTTHQIQVKSVKDSPEALDAYIEAMWPHWRKTFSDSFGEVEVFLALFGSVDRDRSQEILDDADRYESMMVNAQRIQTELQELSQALTDIPVPESMANAHRNGAALLWHMGEQTMLASQIKDDPVRATIATTALEGLLSRTATAFLIEYTQSLKLAIETVIASQGSEQ